MTVKELMAILSEFDQDMAVGFEHPSHDYWRTKLISRIDNVDKGYAKYSEYHRQLAVPTERELDQHVRGIHDEEDDKESPIKRMVVIS